MSLTVDIKRIGAYKKLRDKSTVIGALPNLLNEDPRRFGWLEENNRMDLKKGCEQFQDEGYGDLFHSFFDCILKTSREGIPLKQVIGSDFVSNRRNLRLFAQSVLSGSSFVIRALRKKNVIFLCDIRSENEGPDEDPGHGYKFEQLMSLNDYGEPHGADEAVSNAECFKAVLRATFKMDSEEIKVLYAAEIDARDKDGKFVEIETSRHNLKQWIKLRGLTVYLQSFLGGVSYIVRGQTTGNKIVVKVDKTVTKDIPNMGVSWEPQVCFDRLFEILREIKIRLDKDDTAIVIKCTKGQIVYETEDPEDCKFVDPDFLNQFARETSSHCIAHSYWSSLSSPRYPHSLLLHLYFIERQSSKHGIIHWGTGNRFQFVNRNMSVVVNLQLLGTYKKRHNRSAEVGGLPCLLNEDPRRFGLLEEEDQMDLKKGWEEFNDEGYGDAFDSLFDYIRKTSQKSTSLKKALGTDFVLTRRNLISFATKSVHKTSFVIRAVRRNGIIFLCDEVAENEGPSVFRIYGHKFKQYMTLNRVGEPYDKDVAVVNSEYCRSVFKTSFVSGNEQIKVMYSAVVNAEDKDGKLVEIKSNNLDLKTWFYKRSLGTYLQSYFGGSSYIVKGTTNKDNVVYKVDKIPTEEMPKMNLSWTPQECFKKVFDILQEIKIRLENDDDAIIIRSVGWDIFYEPENARNCNFVDPDFLRTFH
ncbi:hypothetical protein B9Z55_016433 [Caenorhabditis nigoni]|uniref:Decapping nuclease n=1 Tax=Caenorhabditis nigoni TaxID=1611254 RepID=A0A2G5T580_9PELO|nr:hypothetical protein B9Z55_016433 [Caenorhabditis nigoni]